MSPARASRNTTGLKVSDLAVPAARYKTCRRCQNGEVGHLVSME
jgi:hypothetical protein